MSFAFPKSHAAVIFIASAIFLGICIPNHAYSIPFSDILNSADDNSDECYGETLGVFAEGLLTNSKDALGNACNVELRHNDIFGPISENKSHATEVFKEFQEAVCAPWKTEMACLESHIKRNCNQRQVGEIKANHDLNDRILITEAACQPIENNELLAIFKRSINDGFWDCMEEGKLDDTCDVSLNGETHLTFLEAWKEFANCSEANFARICSNGDEGKQAVIQDLVEDWFEFYINVFNSFWSRF